MKLTNEDIQFIDSYLKKEGVNYADIRYEMVDHIASAVEEKMALRQAGFYYAFKTYMAANKKEIMKGNNAKNFLSLAETKRFVSFLFKPQMITVLVFLLGLNYFYKDSKIVVDYQQYFKMGIFSAIGIIGLSQFVFFHIILKKRFYYVEKTGRLLFLIYMLNMVLINPFDKNGETNNYYCILLVYVIIAYVLFSVNQITSFYNLKMNRI